MHADRLRALSIPFALILFGPPASAGAGCDLPSWFFDTLEWTYTSTGWWEDDPDRAGYTLQLQFLDDGAVRLFRDEALVSVDRYGVEGTPGGCRLTFDVLRSFDGVWRMWEPNPEVHVFSELCDDCYAHSFVSRADIEVPTCAFDERLVGTWEWEMTTWHFSGTIVTPLSAGYTQQVEIDAFGNLSTFRDQVLERESRYEAVGVGPACGLVSQGLEGGPWRWAIQSSGPGRVIELNLAGECGDLCRTVRMRQREGLPVKQVSWGTVKSLF